MSPAAYLQRQNSRQLPPDAVETRDALNRPCKCPRPRSKSCHRSGADIITSPRAGRPGRCAPALLTRSTYPIPLRSLEIAWSHISLPREHLALLSEPRQIRRRSKGDGRHRRGRSRHHRHRPACHAGQRAGLYAMGAPPRNLTVGSVSVPPIPRGDARLWFYRLYIPPRSRRPSMLARSTRGIQCQTQYTCMSRLNAASGWQEGVLARNSPTNWKP
jgi:hypothetical protein